MWADVGRAATGRRTSATVELASGASWRSGGGNTRDVGVGVAGGLTRQAARGARGGAPRLLIDRDEPEEVFARVPELAEQTDPVLLQLDQLLVDDDQLSAQVRGDL